MIEIRCWLGLCLGLGAVAPPLWAAPRAPNVLLISVDTLRADRMSGYGYERRTSPNIDALLARGVRFTEARTVEPLTAPALATMLISLPPHEHGSTRNGLPIRSELPSLPRILRRHGYRTGAFVGSWTLRKGLWGMNSHFDHYEAVLTRSRWLGLWTREAKAEDINRQALAWLSEQVDREPHRPSLLWVHYVEPHSPYVLHEDFTEQVGPAPEGDTTAKSYRYDTEIAYVDDQIGQLLAAIRDLMPEENRITLFVSDHGESLGEHDYWGHGRHLYEPTLRIPMGIVWTGRIEPAVMDAPALIGDLAPSIVGLLGLTVPDFFQGWDWSGVLAGEESAPHDRVTLYETHKGAVKPVEERARVRQQGLLEVALLDREHKEIFSLKEKTSKRFDLSADPDELVDLSAPDGSPSGRLGSWLREVQAGLVRSDELPPPSLSEEDVEALRALGYLE